VKSDQDAPLSTGVLSAMLPGTGIFGAGRRGPPGGMGETGTSAIVPAIANAIFSATGKRLRKMPIDASILKQPV
jgi:isoquinoline 1-oxidoreductase beta subunit